MKKIKLTRRKKIIAGVACATVLAVSLVLIRTVNSKNIDTSTLENVNKSPLTNNNVPSEEQVSTQTEIVESNCSNLKDEHQSKKMVDFGCWNSNCDSTLVVVNKANLIPDNYKISLASYNGKQIHSSVKDDLVEMINAAASEDVNIFIYSGYRTIEEQTKYFNSQTSMYKKQGYSEQAAQEKAAQSVARPKTSEHNTGLAIDFNCVRDDFYKTKEYAWLIKNAHKYGFILRYAKDKIDKTGVIYEPWHFRYVGKEYSTKIMESGLCLEEYVEKLITTK